jgi:hypothetical protein
MLLVDRFHVFDRKKAFSSHLLDIFHTEFKVIDYYVMERAVLRRV